MNSARLFLVDGTSGVWKEDLVRYIDHVLVDATVVRKFTTRSAREGEDLQLTDLDQIDDLTFAQVSPDYVYEYGGHKYGIKKSQIAVALERFASVFVIVRNAEIIDSLRTDFSRHCPTSAFVYMDGQLVAQRLGADPDDELAASIKQAYLDYLRNPNCYDQVVLNAGAPNDFFRLVDLFMQRGRATRSSISWGSERRPRLVIATSRSTRRLLEVVIATATTASIAFGVNLVTGGALSYWKTVALAFDIGLLVIAATVAAALVVAWQEIE